MKLFRFSFQARITVFALALVGISITVAALIDYRIACARLEQHLGQELLAIVKTLAPQLDGDLVPLIYRQPDGQIQGLEEFEQLRQVLVTAKNNNGLAGHGSPVYLMRPASTYAATGHLEFVVMTDRDPSGAWFVGNVYPAATHHPPVLRGQSAATRIYEDAEGAWISAAAPVYNSRREVVGMIQADRNVSFYQGQARREAAAIGLSAGGCFVLAALLAAAFSRSLTRPLAALLEATQALRGGRLDTRVAITRNDELGDVAQGLNSMATQLQAAQSQLETQAQELRAANQVKSEFLGRMSHELRTPLNGILGFAAILRQGELDAEQRSHLEVVEQSARSLLLLISNLLSFSAVERGEIDSEPADFSPALLLERLSSPFASRTEDKGVRWHLEGLSCLPPIISADATLLEQALSQLFDNAVKFTEQGRITVEAQLIEGTRTELEVSVADTGSGMDDRTQRRIFDVFVQGDGSSTRHQGGTGLGLALARYLVKKMNGDVGVDSRAGTGSRFWIRIPVEVRPEPAPSVPAPAPPDVPSAEPLRVLVAEDHPVNRRLMQALLKKAGCTPVLANNGREAVAAAESTDFDLILMDCQMPEMDGYEATRTIRRLQSCRPHRSWIVAVTANAMDGDREKCILSGMDDFVPKPFEWTALQRVMADAARRPALT